MFDYFSTKILMKEKELSFIFYQNTFTVVLIKRRVYRQIQELFFLVPIGRLLSRAGGSVGFSKTSVVGGEFFLSSSLTSQMGLSADPLISKESNV